MRGGPILIRCEGSGCQPCTGSGNGTVAIGMCAMCGNRLALTNYVMPEHSRDDPRFLGGENMVLTDARDMALVVAIAAWLRMIADQWDPPAADPARGDTP